MVNIIVKVNLKMDNFVKEKYIKKMIMVMIFILGNMKNNYFKLKYFFN